MCSREGYTLGYTTTALGVATEHPEFRRAAPSVLHSRNAPNGTGQTMTAEETIAEVRSIAEAMAIRGAHPGAVSSSVQYRAKEFLYGCPFAPWFSKGRRNLTTTGTAIYNGQPATVPVVKELGGIAAVIDDTAAEICKAITDHLMVANWTQLVECETTPEYRDWTPETAEAAIRTAAKELPELCDKLAQATGLAVVNAPASAQGANEIWPIAQPNAGTGADSPKVSSPDSADVQELCKYLKRRKPSKGQEAEFARDFCRNNGIDITKAANLLRGARRYPHLW
jgi:hypothetical protein